MQVVLHAVGKTDTFLIKASTEHGAVEWGIEAGGRYHDMGRSVAVDKYGDAYVVGQFNSNGTFGSTELQIAQLPNSTYSEPPSDAFVMKVRTP